MASTLTLQLFSYRKPTVSISLDSPSMMSLVSGFLNCPHSPPMRHRHSGKELCYSIMSIREDQLYEDMLRSGEVALYAKLLNTLVEVSAMLPPTVAWKMQI